MVLILTCRDCRKTSAVEPSLKKIPPGETWLTWACVRCYVNHRWLIPRGRSATHTARQSLKHSVACDKVGNRECVYDRIRGVSPEQRTKIIFGEVLWWWREETGLTQAQAAEAAGYSQRQWIRLEAGENRPHWDNLEKVVHAVHGIMDQAYLLMGSTKSWSIEFKRRVREFEERISPRSDLQLDPEGWKLQADIVPDVELAMAEFRRALPAEPHEDKFLFFAHAIHQAYWTRLLGGTITVDDNRAEIITAVKKLADILERCEGKRAQYMVIYEMARGAELFLTKPEITDLVTYFLLSSFNSIAGEHETRRRIPEEWKQSSAKERLILTLFDLIDPKYKPRLIEVCQKLQASPPQTDEWFKD